MRMPRLLLRTLLLCSVALMATATLAAAAHVPGVLPLTASANHSNEKFSPTVFPVGTYTGYSFAGADLSNCTFLPGTILKGANFEGAKLTNVNFNGCVLDQATFVGADLSFAVLPCFGGGSLRGAILTGVTAGGNACSGCFSFGSNLIDQCTVNATGLNLCLSTGGFRGLISGVVFDDLNSNGLLDLGEPGVPGANVTIALSPSGGASGTTDPRGGYFFQSASVALGSVTVTLPVGYTLAGSPSQSFNLAVCRSTQAIHFPTHSQVTPAQKSTFGRVKALYR